MTQGKQVRAGQMLIMATVDDRDLRIVANFKETQIRQMRIGRITMDAHAGMVFLVRLDRFQPGTGSDFSLLPPENATEI